MVSCPECDKTFQSEAGLSYHTRFHHSQPVSRHMHAWIHVHVYYLRLASTTVYVYLLGCIIICHTNTTEH